MENTLPKCFNCDYELPNVVNLNFCPNCSTQIRCRSCKEALLPNAKICINCGTPVLEKESTTNKNIIDFEQKGTYKKLHSSFSNEVGNTLAETFVAVIGGSLPRRIQNPFTSSNTKASNPHQLNIPYVKKAKEPEDAVVIEDSNLSEVLLRHFQIEEGKLKLTNSRLKQSGKLDHSIRLTLLTLYAYEKAEQIAIERNLLTDILTSASLYNSHFTAWFAKCDEVMKDGGKVQLSVPGRETAEAILKEIADDSIVKGSIVFSKLSKGARRSKKTDTEGSKVDSKNGSSNGKQKKGPAYYFDLLIKEGYFSNKRKIGEIIEYLKVNKAEIYKQEFLSTPLKRMIKSGKLKREKNSENQYEYFA